MNAREKLDRLKKAYGIATDKELAEILNTKKTNIDSWIRRNKIPEKWELKIIQMPYNNIKGNNNVQISGNNNIVSNIEDFEHKELLYLIKNYATPKMLNDFKNKLLKIKEITNG